MCAVGFVFAFLGSSLQNGVIFITSFACLFAYFSFLMLNHFLKRVHFSLGIPIALSILALLCLIVALILTKFRKYELGIISGFGGFLLGLLVNQLLNIQNKFIHYTIIVLLVLTLFILAYKLFKYILIFTTTLSGSYFIVRGLSLYIGSFPNEFEVHNRLFISNNPIKMEEIEW